MESPHIPNCSHPHMASYCVALFDEANDMHALTNKLYCTNGVTVHPLACPGQLAGHMCQTTCTAHSSNSYANTLRTSTALLYCLLVWCTAVGGEKGIEGYIYSESNNESHYTELHRLGLGLILYCRFPPCIQLNKKRCACQSGKSLLAHVLHWALTGPCFSVS